MLLFVLSVTTALLVSFLCSLAEAALLSSSIARVEALARKGHPAAAILRRFKLQPDVPIAAILILNTIAHTAGAAVAGASVEHALPQVPAWLFVTLFTLAVLLLTEILPKTMGVLYGERLLVPVAFSVDMAARLLSPAIWVSKGLSRMVGARNHSSTVSLEEIRLLATAGQSQGAFGSLTAGIIANATRLRETRVREVMVPRHRVTHLSGAHTTQQNLDLVRRTGHSRFPFSPTEDLDGATGVVLTKELLFSLRDRVEPDWEDLLVPLLVMPETATLNNVLRAFQREQRHMAIVVDEYGSVLGIVTLEDVLEEIVGEIEDEMDAAETHVLRRPDGSFLCRGGAEVRKVFADLGIEDVETEAQTLSGFLVEQFGSLPVAGSELDFRGHRFTVTKATNKRAERVRVQRLPATEEPAS
ncbi:MAG: hypothetical protein RL148_2838 [Planctomycetota bacterium]|jgi:putative hemolysin